MFLKNSGIVHRAVSQQNSKFPGRLLNWTLFTEVGNKKSVPSKIKKYLNYGCI